MKEAIRLTADHWLGIDPAPVRQYDRSAWPELAARVQAVIATATRDEWTTRLAGRDVCFAPVLSHQEAAVHPHLVARRALQHGRAAPAPRFSRTPLPLPRPTPLPGADTVETLTALGVSGPRITQMLASGAVAQAARS
jgi:alpha-methylacyl-CoA racemase